MADAETQTTDTPATDLSPAARGLAALSKLGDLDMDPDDLGTDDAPQDAGTQAPATKQAPAQTQEKDELAELAAKVQERLKAKPQPQSQAQGPAWNQAAYKANPIAYLESLGLDVIEHADQLFEFANLSKEQRQARSQAAELERYKSAEKTRQAQEAAAREAAQIDEAERAYVAHLESAKDKYPHLTALEPEERLRYSAEVAQLIVDAGEDADPARLAALTEIRVARLFAKPPGAGAGVQKTKAVEGDRADGSADGGGPATLTSQLSTESGSPAVRDLSPEGRRAAALKRAAALGW
jgi:hypothetical protein